MVYQFVVRGQFPSQAFAHMSDVPEAQIGVRTVSTHRWTRRGFLNALRSAKRATDHYADTHGNEAAHRVWIEVGDYRISQSTAGGYEFMADGIERIATPEEFMTYANRIIEEVNAELVADSRQRAAEAEWYHQRYHQEAC